MNTDFFIKIYDNVISEELNLNINKFVNTLNFEPALTVSGLQDNVRKAGVYSLNNFSNNLTDVKWYNFLYVLFKDKSKQYQIDTKTDIPLDAVMDISILKYKEQDHYLFHSDHCLSCPRTLSFIYFVNDDYTGGELSFKNPGTDDGFDVIPKKDRLLIWPSNFLYPHRVKKVTNGVRYTIVSWLC
jgi:Rps23 Pro-64 3,4-dihydroxylase Tpa1-like proline 4-hydroxylase